MTTLTEREVLAELIRLRKMTRPQATEAEWDAAWRAAMDYVAPENKE